MSQKYDRQSLIEGWDQDILSDSTVAIIGAGALGNHVCLGLIGLGIGAIKIYDYDSIEPHNLNRQSLFCEEDVGENKAEALAKRLEERNSDIIAVGINQKITEENIASVLKRIDVVIDCVDLIHVRKTVNFYCLEQNIPLIHGGISWMGGQVGILTRETPCINCIYPESLQKEELNAVTSCIDKPQASVVYISQIIAGMMVYNVRKVLLPLDSDKTHEECAHGSKLMKVDFRLENPFYFENIRRKEDCKCVEILKKKAPEILKKEAKELSKSEKSDIKEISELLKD